MESLLKLIWLVVVLADEGLLAREVRASASDGKDFLGCGNITQPCRSIRFTIEQVIKDHDVIQLDGGQESALVYKINETVKIKRSFRMEKTPESKFNPILTTNGARYESFRFFIGRTKYISTFKQMNFTNMTLMTIAVFSSLGNMRIENSSIRHCILLNKQVKAVDSYKFDITITYSEILSTGIQFGLGVRSKSIVSVRIKSSFGRNFRFSSFQYRPANTLLSIENSVFEGSSIRRKYDEKKIRFATDISIVGTNFTNSAVLLKGANGCIIIRSLFTNSVLFIRNAAYAYIGKSEFTGYRISAALDQRLSIEDVRTVILNESLFQNSVATEMMMSQCIFRLRNTREKSKIKIIGCVFRNNSAHFAWKTLCVTTKFLQIRNSTFSNNKGYKGGAVSMIGCRRSEIHNCSFVNNTAVRQGGSVFISSGNLSFMRDVSILGSKKQSSQMLTGRLIYSRAKFLKLRNVHLITSVSFESTSRSMLYQSNPRGKAELQNYSMTCPLGHKAKSSGGADGSKTYFASFCVPCGRGRYNLSHGEERTDINGSYIRRNDIKCSECVPGGTCYSNIRSVGNYWGYANNTGHVQFTPCPVNYCCTGKKCLSYNTCERKRTGRLCGQCKKGYSLNMLSASCVSNKSCTKDAFVLFTFTQCITAMAYVFLLLWLKEILLFFKRHLSVKLQMTLQRKNSLNEPLLPRLENPLVISGALKEEETSENRIQIRSISFLPPLDEVGGKKNKNSNLLSGLIRIAFFFYQVEPLLRIHAPIKAEYRPRSWIIQMLISSIFNIKLEGNGRGIIFCPFIGLTTLKKILLKTSFVFTMFAVLFLLYWINKLIIKLRILRKDDGHPKRLNKENSVCDLDHKVPIYAKKPFPVRVKCCAVKLSLLSYKAISEAVLKSINCIPLEKGQLYLYIQADILCYTYWQWLMVGLAAVWVVPFSISFYCASSLLSSCKISPNEFLVVLLFPPALIFFYIRSYLRDDCKCLSEADAMIGKHILMDLYDAFKVDASDKYLMWEPLLVFRKFAIVCATTFIIHPVGKLYAALALLTVFLFHHIHVHPYANKILNRIETCSLVLLNVMASISLFWAHNYMSNDMKMPQFYTIAEVFLLFEVVVLVLPVTFLIAAIAFQLTRTLVHFFINRGSVKQH